MSKAQEVKNELAIKDEQKQSTALSIAQLSDSLPIKAGDVAGAKASILESAAQGKRAWIDTALKIRKVLTVERGKGQAVLDELQKALQWSRSTVRLYQQAGNKLLTCNKPVDQIPDAMAEFMKKAPTAPACALILAIKRLATYTYDKTKWAICVATVKDKVTDEGGKPFGFRVDDSVLPRQLDGVIIRKQGSLNEVDGVVKKSTDYTLHNVEGDEGAPIAIYPISIG